MDANRLVVLAAVADEGGVGPAARALGHTPSAVSQQLSRLEREVGLALVDRSGPRASLTEAGLLLAEHGRRIDQVLARAAGAVDGWSGQAAGRVVLGVPAGGIDVVLGVVLPELALCQPEVEPVIVEVTDDEGLALLRAGRLDVLMLADDRDTAFDLPPRTVATTVVEDQYRVVTPGEGQPRSPAELDAAAWISGPSGSANGRAFARFVGEHGITPARTHIAARPSTLRAMLAAGLGAAVLPQFAAVRTPGVAVCGFAVPGSFVLRMVRRQGPVPAVEAVVSAVRAAVLRGAEDYADSGVAPREPRVRRLRDPSEAAPW